MAISEFLPFQPLDYGRAHSFLAGQWRLVEPSDRLLGPLQGARLAGSRILILAGPRNGIGAVYMRLYLVDGAGAIGDQPLALGLRNSGPFPAYNWVELVDYEPAGQVGGVGVDIRQSSIEAELFALLGDMLPPGGHIMVEYDSPAHWQTARILSAGLPAVCTPIGHALLRAGCLNFRDWYIAEGGSEGPRKLQGFKPLDALAARMRRNELRAAAARALAEIPANASESWHGAARSCAWQALSLLGDLAPD